VAKAANESLVALLVAAVVPEPRLMLASHLMVGAATML
jgi:hypothetical protein